MEGMTNDAHAGLARNAGRLLAAAIDRCYWRMIADGQLPSQGWKIAVSDGFHGLSYSVSCCPVGPGRPAPKGATHLLAMQ